MTIQHLVTRAVEGRLVDGEAQLLRDEVEKLETKARHMEAGLKCLLGWGNLQEPVTKKFINLVVKGSVDET